MISITVDQNERTDCMIYHLNEILSLLHERHPNRLTYLCNPQTAYFSGTPADNRWSCGYRNLQMLLSSFPSTQPASSVPSIPQLQTQLEAAWSEGFDPVGCRQLNGRVSSTRKWIGATEIATILYYCGYHAFIVDVNGNSTASAVGKCTIGRAIGQYVVDYFEGATPSATTKPHSFGLHQTTRPPLYLQHQGHSRLIVGVTVEIGVDEMMEPPVGGSFNRHTANYQLILFDPAIRKPELERWVTAGGAMLANDRLFVNAQALNRRQQYQLVGVCHSITGNDCIIHKDDTEQREWRKRGAYDLRIIPL